MAAIFPHGRQLRHAHDGCSSTYTASRKPCPTFRLVLRVSLRAKFVSCDKLRSVSTKLSSPCNPVINPLHSQPSFLDGPTRTYSSQLSVSGCQALVVSAY